MRRTPVMTLGTAAVLGLLPGSPGTADSGAPTTPACRLPTPARPGTRLRGTAPVARLNCGPAQ
ncbi:hypothetical protein [Streptomyces abikoensis]|uniref:hypothetical protein n=1 Tax=Streptomyces abikoensis TaxID=97398 RepID=UPI0016751F09|nr:hypothetical protein [Streptomyces abikoensis]GGP45312.1 hypothetical protein GCM10010214_17820 [Streptomyces abikoensis]